MEHEGRKGLRQRLFAWQYGQSDSRKLDRPLEAHKRRLLSDLAGDVLEIGPGTGANFAYLTVDIHWTGIEPNLYMHDKLKAEARRAGVTVKAVHPQTVEHLHLPDASMDAVISTHVLCSVNDQTRALAEIRRVLKPGGRFVFVEHVAAPRGSLLRKAQAAVKPVWSFVGDGCHPDRETWQMIENAGFAQVEIEHFRAPYPIASPHIAGSAVR